MRAVDFQFDADEQGRPIKICSIVDEHTRECIGGLVERFAPALLGIADGDLGAWGGGEEDAGGGGGIGKPGGLGGAGDAA